MLYLGLISRARPSESAAMSVPLGRSEMAQRRTVVALLLIFAMFALASSANAGLLANGGSNIADAFTPPNGTIVADTGVLNWAAATMTGTYREYVVRETSSPANVPCAPNFGCLDFIIRVTNNATSADAIGRIVAANFGGSFLIDAGYEVQVPPTGTAPLTVDRSIDGRVIGFNFSPGVTPGTQTALLEIQTN